MQTFTKEELKAIMSQMSFWQQIKYAYIQTGGLMFTALAYLPAAAIVILFATLIVKHLYHLILFIWNV